MKDHFLTQQRIQKKKKKQIEQLRVARRAVDMKRGREKKTGRKRRWRFTLLIRRLGAVLSSVCSRGEHLNSALPPLRRTIQPYFFYSPPAPCPAFLETRQRKTRLESTGKLNSFVKTSRKRGWKERERERGETGESARKRMHELWM